MIVLIIADFLQVMYIHHEKVSPVDCLIFVGYQFSWFSERVRSTKSSNKERAVFCINFEEF